MVTFDSNKVHLDKIQMRGSNAIPALYFPVVVEMVRAGLVDIKQLMIHRMKLDTLLQDMERYYSEHDTAIRAVMINE